MPEVESNSRWSWLRFPTCNQQSDINGIYERMGGVSDEFAKAYPKYPDEEMRYTAADQDAGLPPPETYGGGWCRWATDEARQQPGLTVVALRRLDELEAIETRRDQDIDRVSKACGHNQAIDAHDVLMDQVEAITERAGEIEPQTLECVAVKARIVALEAWDLLFKTPKRDMDWEQKIFLQFITDAMRLGGREILLMPWVTPS